MKIVFFGTSEFAVPILKAIKEKTDWEIGLVICEPAKPVGRTNKITDSPIALTAKELNIEIYTPKSISNSEAKEILLKTKADVFIVVAYGQIIPESIFNIPKFKTVNIHPSLLPKLRGASPIQSALLHGLEETGVSLMIINENMDSGPVLTQYKMEILESDDYKTLENKLADFSSNILIKDLPKYINGEIKPIEQNKNEATFTNLIKKEDGQVNWNKSSKEIYNQYRAFSKWPGLFTFFKNKNGQNIRLKLIEIQKNDNINKPEGEVFFVNKELFIGCKSGVLNIKKLQPENSKTQTATEFINGYKYIIGQKLS